MLCLAQCIASFHANLWKWLRKAIWQLWGNYYHAGFFHSPFFLIMAGKQFHEELAPTVTICIPPELLPQAMSMAQEQPPVHEAWTKAYQRGRHYVITTNSLEDITELADFARAGIEEPEEPLTKTKRQALQTLLERAHRYAELEPMGNCHCMATKWRERPLKTNKATARTMRLLRKKQRNH